MRICYIADARSPISRSWMSHFVHQGHEVHVISTYPCASDVLPGAALHQIPIAFSKLSRVKYDGTIGGRQRRPWLKPLLASLRTGTLSGLVSTVFGWLAPLELSRHVQKAHELILEIAPDLVHAMRIPYEGIFAAKAAPPGTPLVVSVWGNDFTLHARRNALIGRQTRQTLQRVDALHSDAQRDLRLAQQWGSPSDKPMIVLPGAGGIKQDIFYPGPSLAWLREELDIPADAPIVLNPRGFRLASVRQDVFFRAMPGVLQQRPETIFVCTGLKGHPRVLKWIDQMKLGENVRLLPVVAHNQMPDLFRLAQVMISPSLHDGTPNSLLEAMACGCFPTAGGIESVREWIVDGENGLLFDARNPESITAALLHALSEEQLRQTARAKNLELIAERADYNRCMSRAEAFYVTVSQLYSTGVKRVRSET